MGNCCMKVTKPSAAVEALFDAQGCSKAEGAFKLKRVGDKTDPLWEKVKDVLTRSFAGTAETAPEGVFDWAYTPSRTADTAGKPLGEAPSEARLAWFGWIVNYCMLVSLNRRSVYALVETGTDNVVAATLLCPPGASTTQNMGMCEYLALISATGEPPKDDTDGNATKRMSKSDAQLKKLDAAYAPKQAYLMLVVAGVDPKRQSQGAGKALMNLVAAVADVDGAPTYLQTVCKGFETFYEKSGYSVVGRMAVTQGPGAASDLNFNGGVAAMVRPGSGGGAGAGKGIHPAGMHPAPPDAK